MTELTEHDHRPSPSSAQDDAVLAAAAAAASSSKANNGAMPAVTPTAASAAAADANRGVKRPRPSAVADDDDDDEDKPGRERRKIEIKFIQDKSRRHITFSKRKAGIMKKAYELSVLTGTQVLLLVVSETGLVYTFTTPKLQPLVTKTEGKNLIQACLNAPEPATGHENGVDPESTGESPEEAAHSQLPPRHGLSQGAGMPHGYLTPEQQQHAMAYQNYLAQQQAARGNYPLPPQAGMAAHQPQA